MVTHKKGRRSPSPTCTHPPNKTRPAVSACEARPGPISTLFALGNRAIKMDGATLCRRNLLALLSFPSVVQLVNLSLHVSCLRNSPSVVETCSREKKIKCAERDGGVGGGRRGRKEKMFRARSDSARTVISPSLGLMRRGRNRQQRLVLCDIRLRG